MKDTIQITCKAAVTMDLADLQPLQGNLKELSVANFEKLKTLHSEARLVVSVLRPGSGTEQAQV